MRGLTARGPRRRSTRRTPEVGEPAGGAPGSHVEAPTDHAGLGELIAHLTRSSEQGDSGPPVSRVLLRQIGVAAAGSARRAGVVAVASGRWLGDTLLEVAPHLPVRDLETLRSHHKGLEGEALADALTRNAAVASAAVGAGGGALAAVSWSTPVSLATVPIQLAVETLVVAAIEVKLVAELHEVYGLGVRGTGTQRGLAYAASWANRRGVNPLDPKVAALAVTRATRARVQRRVVARAGRSVGTAAPFLLGAAYGAWLNRRTTADLAAELRLDLRRKRPLTGGLAGHVVRGALRLSR